MSPNALDLFLQACGVAGPLQLSVGVPGKPRPLRRLLPQPFAVLGSSPTLDVPLPHEQVSPAHVYLQMILGRAFCVDLQSQTGTHWGRGPQRAGWLERGQPLRVGPYTLRLDDDAPDPAARPADDWNPLAGQSAEQHYLPGMTLDLLNRTPKKVRRRVRRTLTLLGKAVECPVRLSGPSVSRYHAALLGTPFGLWAVDLLGEEGEPTWQGISVNGARVRYARLTEGDELRVGKFLFRLNYAADPHPLQPGEAPEDESPTEGLVAGASNPRPAANGNRGWQVLSPPLTASAPPGGEASPVPAFTPGPAGTYPLAPAFPDPTAFTQGLLLPLLDRFSLMQQQMAAQFQQALMMMLERFGALHQDQMALIRDEMDRMHQLTLELHSLQAELGKHPVPDRAAKPAAAPAPTPAARPAAAPSPPPAAARNGPARTANGPAAVGPLPPDNAPDRDVHAWLCERMEAIEQERQTRWQKVLGWMLGKG